ncbi:helix-turn-helix domain-containing protein [Nocardia sp. SYP-A9097]|uniref:helix-turn-helix transcriptional regulator n=1 Tax=Nocardia sp. SYP-A9097 TaxID=2663237 RepID=UPI00129A3EFF|nr:helix-turn-helix transcriptional regulator [Nocardia sp. SYP-A9097]MRH86014.1 helix-turn-helix domain-containing protein [Nocardia sp. SYP-A9097]
MSIAHVIRDRRKALGLTQEELGAAVGVTEKQVSRWESVSTRVSQEPAATNCRKLAVALGLTLDELLGVSPVGLDLSGQWFAAWDTTRDGQPVIDRHVIMANHRGSTLTFAATGDYLWTGDLRLVENSLMGTYLATDSHGVQRGSLYFLLGPKADAALGRWSGRSVDSMIGHGWGVLARTEDRAAELLKLAIHRDGPVEQWPDSDDELLDRMAELSSIDTDPDGPSPVH